MHPDARRLIVELGLREHPEGGYFAETYRSRIGLDLRSGTRSAITSIYYLLTGATFSAFHRLASDELWHHYRGAAVAIEAIDPDGQNHEFVIGNGARWQAAIPAGLWFTAHVADPTGYALVGCDVAPGFDFAEFEMGSRAELQKAFPQHARLIARWTRDD